MKLRFSCLLVFLLFATQLKLEAQDKLIHGFVTAFDSIPVAGAKVSSKATNHTVFTDSLGYFAIVANNKDKLKVNANGFFKQNIRLNKQTKLAAINLTLKPDEAHRIIATGYGYVENDNNVNAMASVDIEGFNFAIYNDMYELIKGRIPGVEIEGGEIRIRGVNSVNCSNAALIIVDGMTAEQRVLHSISPNEVKNISVIKDASAAIYGFQGVNGVIIIETKRGREL